MNATTITISGPHRQCATEYGYGDYYRATDEFGVEHDNICIARGHRVDRRDLHRMARRVKARLRAEHCRLYSLLPCQDIFVVYE